MNLTQPLDDLEWQTLIQLTAAHFDDLTIKRGFQYYKQGRVQSMQMFDSGHIGAVVRGNQDNYTVDLNPSLLPDSSCTCPVDGTCKHMAAVLLLAAVKQGRSVHALVNAHATALIRGDLSRAEPEEPRRSAQTAGSRQAEALAGFRAEAEALEKQPVSAWHDLFKRAAAALNLQPSSSLYARETLNVLYRIKPAWKGTLDTLYELHAHLFVLDRLIRQSQPPGAGASLFMGYHVQMAADDIEKSIARCLADGSWTLRLEDAGPLLAEKMKETLSFLRGKMLAEARNQPFFAHIYNHVWIFGIAPGSPEDFWYADELKQLQAAEADPAGVYSRSAGMLAQSLMYFYLRRDDKAWELLRAADRALYIQPEQLLQYLDEIVRLGEWGRLTEWLVEIGPLLAGYRNHKINDYMAYWDLAAEHVPDSEQRMWNTLVEMLPYSRDIYQETLLARGQYKQWMDYQLSTGREPLEFRVSVLQPIEKEAPELLLPFYHQAVERYILQKNRPSYKAAVKLLKRLSKLYKKLKQTDRWDLFIDSLASRHSRLRALQEELRRGKLIT